jgi:hypothetical protein
VHVRGRRSPRRLSIGLQVMEGRHLALAQLRETRSDLLCARLSALQINLTGARAQRGAELLEKIADAIAHAERLLFFCGRR